MAMFECRLGHVRKLLMTCNCAFFYSWYSGMFHKSQLITRCSMAGKMAKIEIPISILEFYSSLRKGDLGNVFLPEIFFQLLNNSY